jgi:UDP-3-O-[3-hydroxymyristoyl] N-acetylglucosamine deacetylase/3-hydroxyacyl-[acyl-carrier-protein] dehydratase
LAAFSGMGVDNAIVELDANEPPIADGSSREYCRLIREAGIVPLPERKEPYRVAAPIEFQSGETFMSLFPSDTFKVSCTSQDNDGRFTQFYSLEINPQTWDSELSHARTFCFFEEIEYLIKNGLIKGGSLENAIVVRDDAVLTTEPLRYPEEFVRHKILDIVGDLSLAGRPLHGHLVAIRPSHTANCEMSRQIVAQMRKPLVAAQTFAPPPLVSTPTAQASGTPGPEVPVADGSTLDIKQIMKILPHRYPFLMVDKVTKIDGNKISAIKNVSINEGYFEGHFPGHPIMPGVLQLEAIAQVAGILMLKQLENAGKLAYFMSAERVRWRQPVRPGDALVIDVELTKVRGKLGRAKGVCSVDGESVSEAEVTFMLMEQ